MLLLDTHVFLWFESHDARLVKDVCDEIERCPDVFISIVSFWEIAIKNSLGKLTLAASITDLMGDCAAYGFSILPIHASHLDQIKDLPLIHRDPFDRLLICQAQVEKLKLVTFDENIRKYNVETL